jgi:hypothetical protein
LDVLQANSVTDEYNELNPYRGDYDRSATFQWGGDLDETAAAVIAAAVLTQITGGVLFDPEEGVTLTSESALAMARETIQQTDSLS